MIISLGLRTYFTTVALVDDQIPAYQLDNNNKKLGIFLDLKKQLILNRQILLEKLLS